MYYEWSIHDSLLTFKRFLKHFISLNNKRCVTVRSFTHSYYFIIIIICFISKTFWKKSIYIAWLAKWRHTKTSKDCIDNNIKRVDVTKINWYKYKRSTGVYESLLFLLPFKRLHHLEKSITAYLSDRLLFLFDPIIDW